MEDCYMMKRRDEVLWGSGELECLLSEHLKFVKQAFGQRTEWDRNTLWRRSPKRRCPIREDDQDAHCQDPNHSKAPLGEICTIAVGSSEEEPLHLTKKYTPIGQDTRKYTWQTDCQTKAKEPREHLFWKRRLWRGPVSTRWCIGGNIVSHQLHHQEDFDWQWKTRKYPLVGCVCQNGHWS